MHEQELIINIHACLWYPSCNLGSFSLQLHSIETKFSLFSCQFASSYLKFYDLVEKDYF